MFTLKAKIKPADTIIKSHGLDENGQVSTFLRDEVDRFCDAYVPMQSGTLKNVKSYPNNHSIKYMSPYAHYMYKGKVAIGASRPKGVKRTISNKDLQYNGAPKRGAEWDKRMINDKKNTIIRDVTNYIKGV